jgi:hypothetical protein
MFSKAVVSKTTEMWEEDRESIVNTSYSGNRTNQSVKVFKTTKSTDAYGAQFHHVGHDQINHHRTKGAIQFHDLLAYI